MRLSPILSAGADICKARLRCRWVLAPPLKGRQGWGFTILHYNPAMPVKNIVTGQKVTKEKLQRAKELRRNMTPAEKILWEELRANKLGVHFRPPPPLSGHLP